MLDVHHDVEVVQQHPALLAVALAADRSGIQLAQCLLDAVDHGADLAFVGGGDDEEHVGDGQLLRHVEGDEVGAELVGRRGGGGLGEPEGMVGGGQGSLFVGWYGVGWVG